MRRVSDKSVVVTVIACFIIVCAAVTLLIFTVDPSQLYHRHETYLGDQRYEIAGVAKNHDYDAAILGTSMAMNHYPEQVDSLFGWKTKNMSMMAATHDEYDVLLPYLVKQGKAKNIIFSLDLFSFISELGAIPKELYDDNPFNDISYLLSYQGLKHSIGYLKNPYGEKGLYHFESPCGMEHVKNSLEASLKGKTKVYDLDKNTKDFDNHILRHIKEAPKDIKWHVYLAPCNIAEFSGMHQQGQLENALALRKHILEELNVLENVEVYDFQNEDWIMDMEEYMDVHHHSHKYNREIINSIYAGKYRYKSDSIDYFNERIRVLAPLFLDSFQISHTSL